MPFRRSCRHAWVTDSTGNLAAMQKGRFSESTELTERSRVTEQDQLRSPKSFPKAIGIHVSLVCEILGRLKSEPVASFR